MSIILDALRKAQKDRQIQTPPIFPQKSAEKKYDKQKLAFFGISGGLVCLILFFLFFPFQKKPAPIQITAVKNPPVTLATPNPAPPPSDKMKTDNQFWKFTQEPETVKKIAPKNPEQIIPSKQQAHDTGQILPVKDTKVLINKVDDEGIIDAFNEAVEETAKGRLEVAKALYLGIIKKKPDYIEALNNLGLIAMKQDNLQEALSAFRKCLAYKKDYAKAYNNIGLIMMREGDILVAEEYFRKTIELDSNNIEPYLNLASILRDNKRYDNASDLLEPLINRQVEDASLFLSLAIIKDEMGQYNNAIRYYRAYLNTGGGKEQRNNIINRLKILETNRATKNF
jgi:Flp pilus assembly protein TadD